MSKSKSKAKAKVSAKFAVGDKVTTVYEVNGCPAGTIAEVLEVQNGGAIFRSKFTGGPKIGQVIRNVAEDLNLAPLTRKEREARGAR